MANIFERRKQNNEGKSKEKYKQISTNYKEKFDVNIDIIKKNLEAISSIRTQIENKNKDIADEIEKIFKLDNGISYPGKYEYKKDFVFNLLKKIKNSLYNEEYENTDDSEQVDAAIKKFNHIANLEIRTKEKPY